MTFLVLGSDRHHNIWMKCTMFNQLVYKGVFVKVNYKCAFGLLFVGKNTLTAVRQTKRILNWYVKVITNALKLRRNVEIIMPFQRIWRVCAMFRYCVLSKHKRILVCFQAIVLAKNGKTNLSSAQLPATFNNTLMSWISNYHTKNLYWKQLARQLAFVFLWRGA